MGGDGGGGDLVVDDDDVKDREKVVNGLVVKAASRHVVTALRRKTETIASVVV